MANYKKKQTNNIWLFRLINLTKTKLIKLVKNWSNSFTLSMNTVIMWWNGCQKEHLHEAKPHWIHSKLMALHGQQSRATTWRQKLISLFRQWQVLHPLSGLGLQLEQSLCPLGVGVTTLAHNESERAPEGRDLLVRSGELAEHSRWIITKVCVVTKMVTVYSTGQFFQ